MKIILSLSLVIFCAQEMLQASPYETLILYSFTQVYTDATVKVQTFDALLKDLPDICYQGADLPTPHFDLITQHYIKKGFEQYCLKNKREHLADTDSFDLFMQGALGKSGFEYFKNRLPTLLSLIVQAKPYYGTVLLAWTQNAVLPKKYIKRLNKDCYKEVEETIEFGLSLKEKIKKFNSCTIL